MTDRELLQAAAKSAGLLVQGDETSGLAGFIGLSIREDDNPGGYCWNPLTDNGDALRLAVKLGLAVVPYPIYAKPKHSVIAKQYDHARYLRGEGEGVRCEEIEVYGDDPLAATRRAITRAAAAIGGAR